MQFVQASDARIPALGFGTWTLRGAQARAMVEAALELGYRHIDTAQMYGNEREVGEAIRASGIPREQIFLTTKIWPDHFREEDCATAIEERLDWLKTGWLDLLLLHWPNPSVPLAETLAVLDDVKASGAVRHIGVSNFTTHLLEEALRHARAPIVCNQVEYHPFLSQKKLLETQRRHGIALTAYSPIARGKVTGHPVIEEIAARHGRTAIQVTLRWLVQQEGVAAIPRSSSAQNARANLEIFDFQLTPADMAAITALGSPQGRMVHNAELDPEWDED